MHMNFIKKTLLLSLVVSLSPISQAATPSWTPKAGSQLSFISRSNGKPTGTLVFDFTQSGDRIVERRVEHLELSRMLLKAAMDQTLESTWRGQTLESFTSNTIVKSSVKDSNESLKVTRLANGKLSATTQDESHELDADAWPLTLSSRSFISHSPVFDLGKGKIITVNGVSKGFEPITADGVTQNCERFETKATQDKTSTDVVLWYDSIGRLCGMRYPTVMGTVDYIRTSVK